MHISSCFPQTTVYSELTHNSLTDQLAMNEEDQANLNKWLSSVPQDREGTLADTNRKFTHLPPLNLITPLLENLSCWEKTQIVAAVNPIFPQEDSNQLILKEKNATPLSTTEVNREEQSVSAQNILQTENDLTYSNSEQMTETSQSSKHVSQDNQVPGLSTSELQQIHSSDSLKKTKRNVSENTARFLNEQNTGLIQENNTPSEARPRTNINLSSPTSIRNTMPLQVENPNTIDLAAISSRFTKLLNAAQKIRKIAKNIFNLISKASLSLIDKGKFLFKQLGGTALKISNQIWLIFYQRQEHSYNAPVQYITNVTNNNYYTVSNSSPPTRCSEEQFRQTSTPSVPMAAATA